jgi:hypothetical protein
MGESILVDLLGRPSLSFPLPLKTETDLAFETLWLFSLGRWILFTITVKIKSHMFPVRIWVCPPYHMDCSAEKLFNIHR